MAERSVKVILEAQVAGFAASMKSAALAVKDLSTGSASAHQQMAKSARVAADASQRAYQQAAKAARDAAAAEKAAAKDADDAAKQRLRAATTTAKAAAAAAKEDWQAKAGVARDAERQARAAAASATDVRQAWDKTSTSLLMGGTAIVAGVGGIAKVSMDFEKSMSGVRAVANASASDMTSLSDAAKRLGAETSFSATQAAQAEAELVKAGVSVKDVLGGALKGSMDLAAAGQLDLAEAATISAQAMNLFGLSGDKVTHIADVLASGANKSAADVHDLGLGLSQAGTIAKQAGLSLEDTTATLALFADNGMKGSDAGTSLKTMLMSLSPTSKEAAAVMDDMGLSFFDARGQFVGMEEASKRLAKAMAGMSQEQQAAAMKTIFGSDAARAANVLLDSQSEKAKAAGKSWGDYRAAMNDAGAAGRMAATQLDNLAGDWEKLTGALETTALNSGGGLGSGLRSLVQEATDVVDALNKIPAPIMDIGAQAALSLGGAAATMGGLMSGVGKLSEYRTRLKEIETQAPKSAKAIKLVGVAAASIAALQIAGAVLDEFNKIEIGAEELVNRLLDKRSTLETVFRGVHTQGLFGLGEHDLANIDDIDRALTHLGSNDGLDRFTRGVDSAVSSATRLFGDGAKRDYMVVDDHLHKIGESFAKVAQSDLPQAQAAFRHLYEQIAPENRATLFDRMPAYRDALYGIANQAGITADETTLLKLATGDMIVGMTKAGDVTGTTAAGLAGVASGMDDTKASAEDLEKSLNAVEKALRALGGEQLSVEEAVSGWWQALADANTALDTNARTLDQTTEAGRKNREVLTDVARAAEDLAIAQTKNGDKAAGVRAWEAGRKKVVELAIAMGATRAEAEKLADARFGKPGQASTALDELAKIDKQIDGLKAKDPITVGVTIPTAAKAASDLAMVGMGADAVDGKSPTVNMSVPNALGAVNDLNNVSVAADVADGKAPSVGVTAPGATTATRQLWGTTSAAQAVDAQSPTVGVSTNAGTITGLLHGTVGAAGVVDAQSPNVGVSTNAWSATQQLYGTSAAANALDGRVVSLSVQVRGANPALGTLLAWGGLEAGGLFEYARGGGYGLAGPVDRVSQIAKDKDIYWPHPGGGVARWAEPWLPWEAYISGDPAQRQRSLGIWAQTGRKLGVAGFDTGGLVQYAAGGTSWDPAVGTMMSWAATAFSKAADTAREAQDRLKSAQAAVAEARADRARATSAREIADANARIAKAMAEQRAAQTALTAAQKAAKVSMGERFNTAAQTKFLADRSFLTNVTRIRDLGFPRLAYALLEDGSEDAMRTAADLARAPRARLQWAQTRLDADAQTQAGLAALKDSLTPGGVSGAAAAQAQLATLINSWAPQAARFRPFGPSPTALGSTSGRLVVDMPSQVVLNVDGQAMTALVEVVSRKTYHRETWDARSRL